jgi:hypothetical protein
MLLLILYTLKQDHIQITFMLVYNVISEENQARVANKKCKIVITLKGGKKCCVYELLSFSFEMNTNVRKTTMLLSSVWKSR